MTDAQIKAVAALWDATQWVAADPRDVIPERFRLPIVAARDAMGAAFPKNHPVNAAPDSGAPVDDGDDE